MIFLIALLITASAILLCLVICPAIVGLVETWRKNKETVIARELDNLFYDKSPQRLVRLYFILPPVLGVLGLLFFKSVIALAAGALLGLFIPNFMLKMRDNQRKRKFNNQILDAIMILSSSLKGGLSLLQALEVLTEEVPAPMSQEVGLVVRENKMGISLEESLRHLSRRINLEELDLVVNSILVARETGGDLTKVFSRLSTTIRDNRKLKDSIRTLTLQGRMQGFIMSGLPFLFIWWVITFNRQHFDVMLQTETGRTLLFVAIGLQIVGMILIRKFSTVRI